MGRELYLHCDIEGAAVTHRLAVREGAAVGDALRELLGIVAARRPGGEWGAAEWGLCDAEEQPLPAERPLSEFGDGDDLFLCPAPPPAYSFYVHTSGGLPELTFRADAAQLGLSGTATVADLAAAVREKHFSAHSGQLEVAVGDDEGPAAGPHRRLWRCVAAGDDVFVRPAPAAAAAPPAAALAAPAPAPAPAPAAAAPARARAAPPESATAGEEAALKRFLNMAAEATEKRCYARALEIYSSVLKVAQEEPNCLRGRARVNALAGRWAQAAEDWAKLCNVLSRAGEPPRAEELLEYGAALRQGGRCDDAVGVLSGQCIQAIREQSPPEEFLHEFKVELGHAYLGSKRDDAQENALALWVSVLQETNQEHCGAMLAYTDWCRKLGKVSDAMQGVLKMLVAHSGDKRVREAFGTLVRETPDAVRVLREEFKLFTAKSGEALAFLAVVAKDHGAIDESIEMYKMSCLQSPGSASFALNYAHTLEVKCRHWDAVAAIAEFCERNPERSAPTSDGGRVTCTAVRELLLPCLQAGSPQRWLSGAAAAQRAAAGLVVRWVDDGVVELPAAEAPEPMSTDATVPENLRPLEQRKRKEPHGLSPEELDLIALWSTAVKNLFVLGCVAALPPLLRLLDPLRRHRELHTTLIRNEQAYFCAIAQLMQYLPLEPRPAELPLLWACGDSHSLSPSWHTVRVQGKEHLITNRLVTGLKCWHLRPGNHFYPKYNFLAAVDGIPHGAAVLLIFGEIDCREGILFAVERAKYSTVDEGMRATIRIYIDALLELQKRKGLRLFVHPALPVLDPTRQLVVRFNTLLGEALAEDPRVRENGSIRWLDFFRKLLTPDGTKLLPQYQLDGTHICPSYLTLVQEALDEHSR
eukprot:TRINITY_DN1901_c1_g1_i1.p1 TRINITY_DN1901_c1_g1~~TRINITY_DN1901_c1_g1_i1.p1  ORF type:complete len:893 (+),score=272.65 TRINITY_DN1901_c1_g1_i1:75-2681(+)